MDKSNKPTLAERQDELKARMTSGKYKALVSKPPTPLEPPAPSERSSMTVRELIQQLSGMDPECVLRVDMYDREYLLTRGTASYLEVGGAEPILRAIKGTGEKDDWEILDELRQANPWRGEPTGCCRLVGRKNKAEPCGRPAVVVHENSPFCWRHYPPHLEVRDREKSEFDEYRERCLEEQERKEAEMAAKPGAMEFLPESDSPFSIKPIANTWHYLPEVTHVS
jgi:hypothetical protein